MHRLPHRTSPAQQQRPALGGLLALLSLAQLMVILDISAVNVALPDLTQDLGFSSGQIGWAITSYSLVFGSLLLLGGRAADLIGRRRMFRAGLGIFTVSSLLSAVAGSAGLFLAARAGQGLGAAMLSPAALSIITSTFHGADRARALGIWGAVGGAGAAIGVLAGGMLTEWIDWRAIFFINLPIGIGVGIAIKHVVPADALKAQWRSLDVRGAVIATASLAAIVYSLSTAGAHGWLAFETVGLGAAGLVGLVTFALYEKTATVPLLNVRRLGERGVGGGFVMMLTTSAILFGTFLLTSMYLQEVLGAGALATGLAFLPIAVATGVGSHAGSHVVGHLGLRGAMAGAFAVIAIGALLLSTADSDGTYLGDVLPGMLLAGFGMGVALVSVALAVLTGADESESGMLSGLNTTGHEIGGSFGIALLVSIASSGVTSSASLAEGIGDAFLAAGIIAALGAMVAPLVLPAADKFLPQLRAAPRVSMH
jgi:EmrB/QacA subfamily drug resistance transporter